MTQTFVLKNTRKTGTSWPPVFLSSLAALVVPFALTLASLAFCLVPLHAAEDLKMPVDLDKLAQRATETVDVSLDQSMLQLASGFLSKDDPDEARIKKLTSKLKGVYVRSFEFDKEGQYSLADVAAIRAQLKAPNWSRVVGVKSKGENTEIYIFKKGDEFGGLVVLDAEPKELTIVHIDGPINPSELSELSGHMGIPDIVKEKSKDARKEEE
jgi:hypothetical protein